GSVERFDCLLLATFELNRLRSHVDRLFSIGLFLRGRTATTSTEDHLGGLVASPLVHGVLVANVLKYGRVPVPARLENVSMAFVVFACRCSVERYIDDGLRGLLACGDASKYVLVSLVLHRLDSIRLACGSLLLVSRLFLLSGLVFPLTALVFDHVPCKFKLGLILLERWR